MDSLIKLLEENAIHIIMVDFNAKICERKITDVIGEYSLGNRNDRCDKLVKICPHYEMIALNT